MLDLPRSACWTEETARAVLQTEALANREAAFLAIHQPLRDFEVQGSRGSEIADLSDAGVLAALSAPGIRHAFCVVEGEPGAGKSHLIRWLKVQWPKSDLALLVQRADGSLTGTLRELKNELGPAYGGLFDRLGQNMQAGFEGRAALFHAGLAESLKPGFFETPLPDEDWCGRWDLRHLLGHPVVRDQWKGPERLLSIMSGHGGERDSESASFNLYDIADLARLAPSIDKPPPKALMFLRHLEKERERIELLRAEGRPARELLDMPGLNVPESMKLVDALNRRRDFAVQHVLGISADGLKQMFLELRQKLQKEGRRLVLLLEDITSWEGVDNQLIDALVADSRTREKTDENGEAVSDVCDLISVAGITPDFFHRLRGNYNDRITHILKLGHESTYGHFQQTTQLATAEAQVAFAANYLRAARADLKVLEDWRRDGARREALPNPCNDCQLRLGCHASFGAHDQVGLFPFTAQAIVKIFGALHDPRGTRTLQTPRGMIQGVLSQVLLNPSRLGDGKFPPPELEATDWLPDDMRRPSSSYLAQMIEAAEQDPERADQLRRLVMLWGNDQTATTVDVDGMPTFAGIRRNIFDAFGLSWLGSQTHATSIQPVENSTVEDVRPPTAKEEASTEAQAASPVAKPKATTATVAAEKTSAALNISSPPAKKVDAKKLREEISQLHDWRDGKGLSEPKQWESTLAEIMGQLSLGRLGIPRVLWDRLFTKETVRLEGVGRTDVRTFVLPRADWVVRGVEAYITLRAAKDLPPEMEETYRRNYGRLLRRLGELAAAHARKRLTAEENPWSPAATCAQILLARTWLRGNVSPDQPLPQQFTELLSEERPPSSNPEERVESWSTLVTATGGTHERLRDYLRHLLAMPQDEREIKLGLVDAGEVADALASLQKTMRMVPVPPQVTDSQKSPSRGLDEILKIAELATKLDDTLSLIPDREFRSLTNRSVRLQVLLREHSVAGHLKRVDSALTKLRGLLIQAAPTAIDDWAKALDKLRTAQFLDDRPDGPARRIEEFLFDECAPPGTPALLLARVLAAPALEMRQLSDALALGEKAIAEAFNYASAYLASTSGDGDLSVVNGFGRTLHDRASAIRSTLDGTP